MRWLWLAFGLLQACTGPELVQVLDRAGDAVGLVEVPRGSLVDLDRVEGPYARFLVGADFEVAPWLASPLAREQAARDLSGQVRAPRTRWSTVGGTAIALDFDTLALFTAYVHTERAIRLFEDAGLSGPAVGRVDVLYLPELRDAWRVGMSASDNAYYFLPNDTVLLLPPRELQDLPLAMNAGVLAHELTHRVVHELLWEGRRLEVLDAHRPLLRDDPARRESYLLLLSLDEGAADYVGAVLTDAPDFVGLSLGSHQHARDLSRERQYPTDWIGDPERWSDIGAYDPYPLGTVFASALWRAGELVGHDRVVPALLRALERSAPRAVALELSHTDLEVEVLRALGGDPDACAAFGEVYAPSWGPFTEVCP